jgi:riboflavin biosynthesis pyrimidine reductase
MRALVPSDLDLSTDRALHRAYAPPSRAWVRANFISSIDGAAVLDGTAGGLGNPMDQTVLAILRTHADVVVVGAGTTRAENYGPLRHTDAQAALRREDGRAHPARLAVISRSMRFTGRERWIADAPVPPLLLTGGASARDIPGAETVVCGEDAVDPAQAITKLAELGLVGVLCEGGPTVFAEFAASGCIDELCLTMSPMLAGPGALRIVDGVGWKQPRHGVLAQLIEDESLLFARYTFTP